MARDLQYFKTDLFFYDQNDRDFTNIVDKICHTSKFAEQHPVESLSDILSALNWYINKGNDIS